MHVMLNHELVQVRLYGGLGNQLFQFFAGLDLALKNGIPLHLDLSWLDEKSKSVNVFSDPALHELEFPIHLVNHQRTKFLDKTLGNRILRDLKIPAKISHIHVPKEVGFSETYGLPRKIELRGYYQSYKYLNRAKQKISLEAFFTNGAKNLEGEIILICKACTTNWMQIITIRQFKLPEAFTLTYRLWFSRMM